MQSFNRYYSWLGSVSDDFSIFFWARLSKFGKIKRQIYYKQKRNCFKINNRIRKSFRTAIFKLLN